MKKRFIIVLLTLTMVFTLASCKKTDVVGETAKTSFDEILKVIPNNVVADDANGGWALNAPDDSARFIWSKDFATSPDYDVMLEFDAQPFIDAGLDADKLPEGMLVGDKIIVGSDLGDDSITYEKEATPIESFKKIVGLKRDLISYHAALDHYGIMVSEGNMFEWAKDMKKNDKDIVFVLNPQVFIDAGVDPAKVEGWVFAKVETMDMDGKKVEVDKLLKPFDLN
jgi:hypothetical protein